MKKEQKLIYCNTEYANTCRMTPYNIIVYTINHADDGVLLDELYVKAQRLARNVWTGSANNSTIKRDPHLVLSHCLAGVLSEYFWKLYINEHGEIVTETEFTDASIQIDLQTIEKGRKIEVRSSFPFKGIEFAICNGIKPFKIIGPYHNQYKPAEIDKDYYLSCLFPLKNPRDLNKIVKSDSDFSFALSGGATWQMMWDDYSSRVAKLTPEDRSYEVETDYRVVPFQYALDSVQMRSIITGNI